MSKTYKLVIIEIRDQIHTRILWTDNGVIYPRDISVVRVYEVEDPDLIDKTGKIIVHDFPLCNVIEITVEDMEDE